MNVTPTQRALALAAATAVAAVGIYALGRAHPASATGTAGTTAAGTTAVAKRVAAAPADQFAATPAAATTSIADLPASTISVSGTGQVTGTPNLLRLQLSVGVTQPTVAAAMAQANAAAAAVQKALLADGVAAADLQTANLSIQPNYNYSGKSPTLSGYAVSEDMSAVLRNVATAGAAIADAAKAGGNAVQIGSATLDLENDDALVAQARAQAFDAAKAKAQAYARAAGRTLGDVVTIAESDDPDQPITFAAEAAPAASGPAVPIQAGSQDVSVSVTTVWSLN